MRLETVSGCVVEPSGAPDITGHQLPFAELPSKEEYLAGSLYPILR